MCGIVGQVSLDKDFLNKDFIQRSLDAIRYRGPDDSNTWTSKCAKVEFGHNRLSIIDLSVSGRQPFEIDDAAVVGVFNGEIYNYLSIRCDLEKLGYSFKSNTDTEVVLRAYWHWGVDCLSRFNGMFSFAIFDNRKSVVFIARDRAGEKPLYYSFSEKVLIFSSELRPMINYGGEVSKISRSGLDSYLTLGYMQGENSIVEGIQKLNPGSYILFDLTSGSLIIKKYWSVVSNKSKSNLYNIEDCISRFEPLIRESVKLRLQADVPIGILLSGGIDSSIIAKYASDLVGEQLNTYTVINPASPSFDESKRAKAISKIINSNHYEIELPKLDLDDFLQTIRKLDEPFSDLSFYPVRKISQEIKKSCTVVLGGDGGDELFGGYNHYRKIYQLSQLKNLIPVRMSNSLFESLSKILPFGNYYNWLEYLMVKQRNFVPMISRLNNPLERTKLLNFSNDTVSESIWNSIQGKNTSSLVENTLIQDFLNFLPNDILWKVDRMSMLSSIEMRAPFLDESIINFAFNELPIRYKVNGSNSKIILNKLFTKLYPSMALPDRKVGFNIPLLDMMDIEEWKELFCRILIDNVEQIMFNKKHILTLIKNLNNKDYRLLNKLMLVLIIQIWLEENVIEIG